MNKREKIVGRIEGEENLKFVADDLVNTLISLLAAEMEYDRNFGHPARLKKNYWEQKAADLISDIRAGKYCQQKTEKYESTSTTNGTRENG